MSHSLGKIGKFLSREILLTGHLQSLGAAGLVFVAILYYINLNPLDFNIELLGLSLYVYLTFQTIYYYDRFVDLNIDKLTNEKRVAHISLYKKYLPTVILVFTFFLPASLFFIKGELAGLFIGGILLLGFLYPIFFKKLTSVIPLFKNLYVASVFGLMPVFALLYLGLDLSSVEYHFFYFMSYIFLETLIMQMILDMKDIESDSGRKLRTLPVLIGKNKAIFTISILIFLTSYFFIYHFISEKNLILWLVMFFILIGNFVSLFFISKNKSWAYYLEAAKPIWWTVVFVTAKIFL